MRVLWLAICLTASIGLTSTAESALRSSSPMLGDGVPRTGPAGPQGEAGPKGDKGDAGQAGPQGQKGDAGATGYQGQKGDPGSQGIAGQAGPQGLQGAPGKDGQSITGAQGPQGPIGPAGSKASQFVCNATISETIALAVTLAGIRERAGVTCAGVLTTDILEVYPTALPAGFAVHHAVPTAANIFRATISGPALAIGASYSIPVAVYSINR